MEDDIEKVLWTPHQISTRITELAADLRRDLTGVSSPPPLFIGVATGAFIFLADIVRQLDFPVMVDLIRVQSYGSGTVSSGSPTISSDFKLDVSDKHVVLVEDIVDTGNTIARLIAHLKSKGVSSVSVCTFLDKPSRREVAFEMVGKGKYYRGFECPDYFVVGYGMDFAELYRYLPYVGVLKPKIYEGNGEQQRRN